MFAAEQNHNLGQFRRGMRSGRRTVVMLRQPMIQAKSGSPILTTYASAGWQLALKSDSLHIERLVNTDRAQHPLLGGYRPK